MYKTLLPIVFLVTAFLLSGCSTVKGWFGDDEDEVEIADDIPARQLYEKARGELRGNRIQDSIESFELLQSRYPFGPYAQQALLELAYAYYKSGDTDASIDSANRFIQLNPQHPSIAYAYYMKGLANYDRSKTFLNAVLPRDPSNTDPTPLRTAFDDFNILVTRFPDSQYADDAKRRMVYLRNELAEYEIKVAKFYMRREAYVGAANRSKYVMEKYQGAPIMPQALHTLEQAYRKLGIRDLADDTRLVYAENFESGREGMIDADFVETKESCATNGWDRLLEKMGLKTFYCN